MHWCWSHVSHPSKRLLLKKKNCVWVYVGGAREPRCSALHRMYGNGCDTDDGAAVKSSRHYDNGVSQIPGVFWETIQTFEGLAVTQSMALKQASL